MAKRRTRKQKEKAKHEFTVSWEPGEGKRISKRQDKAQSTTEKAGVKSSSESQRVETSKIKKDIFKSLFLAGLIIGIEFALYFTWKK